MKVVFSNITINDSEIRLASAESQTVFVSIFNVEPLDLHSFNRRVADLARKCKENKVRFYRAGVKQLKEMFPDYLESVRKYRALYSELKEIAREIATHGIEIPTVNDERLKLAQKFVAGMDQMLWRSGRISKVNEIVFNLNRFLEKDLKGYESIHL